MAIDSVDRSNLSRTTLVAAVADLVAEMWGAVNEAADGSRIAELQAVAARALDVALDTERRIAEQARRISDLEDAAITDELTGILNRRGFIGELDRALASTRRHGEEGVLVSIDLDGFKAINDTHGHAAGDQTLRHVARLLADNVRTTDSVARLGGDEFAVLLTRVGREDAVSRAEALGRRLNASSLVWEGHVIPVRASVGVVSFGATDTSDHLMCGADQAMYRIKRARSETPGASRAAA